MHGHPQKRQWESLGQTAPTCIPQDAYVCSLDELEHLYATVDKKLLSTPILAATSAPTIHSAQVVRDPDSGVLVHWSSSVLVPFDWTVTTRGMWRFIANDHAIGPMQCELVEVLYLWAAFH